MDVLSTHAKVVEDYAKYIQSFLNIADPEIHATVEARLSEGRLWPESLLQFIPAFESAGTVAEMAAKGIVHHDLVSILKGYSLYRHQVDAIQLGTAGMAGRRVSRIATRGYPPGSAAKCPVPTRLPKRLRCPSKLKSASCPRQ